MHTCECRASSQHRHASDVGLHGSRRRRARQTHGRVRLAETGVGIRGTNPHLKHALERRQYPLCGCEILSVYPPTDYTRQQRSAYGDTPTARLPPLPSTALALRERCRPDQPAAGQVFRPLSRWPAALQLAASPAASSVHGSIPTPGRREPDAARWTQRAGSHPCRDMCGLAQRGACAPDIRRATEFTHWPRLAASK